MDAMVPSPQCPSLTTPAHTKIPDTTFFLLHHTYPRGPPRRRPRAPGHFPERATTVDAPPERWFLGNSANPTGVDLLRQAHARLPLRATTGASEPTTTCYGTVGGLRTLLHCETTTLDTSLVTTMLPRSLIRACYNLVTALQYIHKCISLANNMHLCMHCNAVTRL